MAPPIGVGANPHTRPYGSEMTFRGRVALVTGGGSGMGQLAALRLAGYGADVAIADVNETGMKETVRRGGDRITAYPCDVTDPEVVEDVVGRIEAGHGPIDRLVHAAGIMPAGNILDTPTEKLLAPTRINYFGTVHVTKAVLPAMVSRNRGDVVLFGSITGYAMSTNFAAYCASKAAVNTFAEVLIHENRHTKLRMVLACPSAVQTPLLDQAMSGGPKAFVDTVVAGRAADPDVILDRIEKALERGTKVLVPGEARPTWMLRRLSPSLMWRLVHLMNKD
ncbi:SDR family oxidoreductase [Mycobacterium eburneum]|nr:SDR family oxidoreductase [Mycobacterium eburneum]TDH48361.1 SDR family oxidoreductase [Mycobacterium eburneum]